MASKTGIQWTDATFNPWHGCTKVSAGCDHCYAETLSTRWGRKIWGSDADRLFFGDKHWIEPLRWNADAAKAGTRRRVFCGSMCDWAEGRPDQAEARARLFALIEQTPMLDWQLLTKRPGAIPHLIPAQWLETPPANVWYGTSVEDQEQAEKRIPQLLRVPAIVRFLSCEPLLGSVDLTNIGGPYVEYHDALTGEYQSSREKKTTAAIDWVIAGGESGPGARPMHPGWARALRDQCQLARVAFFFKQWGEWRPFNPATDPAIYMDSPDALLRKWHPQTDTWHAGKKAAGRELDGRTWDEYPEVTP